LPGKAWNIRGYRGGYLPVSGGEIESGPARWKNRGGCFHEQPRTWHDCGFVDTAVMAEIPENIAATWQRDGPRPGRRSGSRCAVLLASS